MTFRHNPEEFDFNVESLPLFDLANISKSDEPDLLDNSLDEDFTFDEIIHMKKNFEHEIGDKDDSVIETEYLVMNSEQEHKDDNEGDEDDEENQETVKLPEVDCLTDLNDIIETYPKTMSALFPLWNKSKIQTEQYKGQIDEDNQYENIDPMIIFQPFTERFKEKFENYLHPRYMRIAQQLYDALVEHCNLWRHFRALAGIYFMQQGETMHQLSDVIFDKVYNILYLYHSFFSKTIKLRPI
jgi:hypothetical protein